MKILSKDNLYIIFQIITIILALLLGNVISYLNISMYLILLLLILLYSNNKNYKNDRITSVFSLIFSLFFSFGNLKAIEAFETYNLPVCIYYAVSFVGYYYLIKNILLFLYKKTKNISITKDKKKQISKKKFIILLTLLGFVLYLPYLLEFFPGITSFDTYNQLNQILGNTAYSNHHPIIHTLIIKFFFDIGYFIFKSNVIGMLFFTIFQMLFVSFTFSNVLYLLYKNNVKKLYLILVFIFYYLVPYNALYSITTYKDVLFSCIMLLFIVFLYDNKESNLNLLKRIELILLSILVCLLRTNGILVIILLLIVLFIKYFNIYKDFIICIFIGLSFSFVFKLSLNVLNIPNPSFEESLSIPLQNIAYVVKNNGNISEEEYNELKKIMDVKKVNELYDVDYVDPIKNMVKDYNKGYLEKNKIKFIKLWFSIGIKNINMYIKSYVYQTSGYWYHNYAVNTFASYDNYDDLQIIHNNYNAPIISKIIGIMMYLNRAFQHVFWSNALSIYIIFYSLYYLIRKNKYRIYIYPIIFIWLSLLIATPVGYEFRYQYSIFISFPFVLASIFIKRSSQNEKNI